MPLITSVTDGLNVFPGQTSLNYAGGGFSNSQKYVATSGSTLFPGLLVGRNEDNNYINATSLDQIVSPDINSIVGALSYSTFAEAAPVSITAGYGNLPAYAAGTLLNIFNQNTGYIWLWMGATFDGTSDLAVAATTTGSGSTLVYAGTLVPASFGAGPVINLSGYMAVNAFSNGITYTRGMLAPVSLSIFNR